MLFRQIFEPKLAQYSYLVGCQDLGEALLIDPQRDIDRYLAAAEEEEIEIVAVAETHIHADFLSGSREFAERLGTRIYLSAEGGKEWSYGWADRRAEGTDGRPEETPGRAEAFDVTLLGDGDEFEVGRIEVRAVHTPGHTPEHLSYLVFDGGAGASGPIGVVSGDFVFVGDLGRPDLLEQAAGKKGVQEDAARVLFRSLPRFLALDDHLQVWPAHGSGSSCGKALGAVPTSTVGYERRHNQAIAAAEKGENAFVEAILSGQPDPPMYFARMKSDNRDGPPLLGALPRPRALTAGELSRLAEDVAPDGDSGGSGGSGDGGGSGDSGGTGGGRGSGGGGGSGRSVVLVDTRLDRSAFMARHIPGSLYAPMNESFNTRVGSMLVSAAGGIVLIADSGHVDEAVRDLIRIGFDHVEGYATPETLLRYLNQGGTSASIREIDFDDLARMRGDTDAVVLDVRYRSEYEAGHVPGAVNAPYTRLAETYEKRVPEGRTLLVHCSTGARSAVASAWLAARGSQVRYVNGFWSSWADSGWPVESGTAGS